MTREKENRVSKNQTDLFHQVYYEQSEKELLPNGEY